MLSVIRFILQKILSPPHAPRLILTPVRPNRRYHPMDWPYAINRHHNALLRIVAVLFAVVGLAEGGALSTLPRHVYRTVMLVLRPAESAVRRLVVMAARGLVVAPRPFRVAPAGIIPRAGAGAKRLPVFCLMDPLKHFGPFFGDVDDDEDEEDADHDYDEYQSWSPPRISVPGYLDPVFLAPPPAPSSLDSVNAQSLARWLMALKLALDDLPKQARRLARWQARRDLARQSQTPFRPRRMSPFRPGLPPGYRKRQCHEVDEVLLDCHSLALYASAPANTS
jgi:hypothetical protein